MDYVTPMWCAPYMKIPYADRGRTKEGLDCYGLIKLVNHEVFHRDVPDYVYSSSLSSKDVAECIEEHLPLDWQKVEVPEAGDLIMLRIAGRPWHCGLFAVPGLMLHAIDRRLSGMDRIDSLRWSSRVMGYYRPLPCN